MFIERIGEEKDYNWFEAAKGYEQALISSSKSVCEVAESWKKIGFCYSRASRPVSYTHLTLPTILLV